MLSLGFPEIAFFFGIVLLLFGPDKIPQIARSIGKATQEYQKALKGVTSSGSDLMGDMKGGASTTALNSTATPTTEENKQIDRETQIMQQAELLGISTSGKTVDQIVDEILSRDTS